MVFRGLSYPQTASSCREKRANWVIPCFPSFPAVIDEILDAREWRCCRWLARKIHCTQIPSSRCNYFLWGKWFLLPVLQAGNAKWSGWQKCYLKQSTRVSLRWEKKGGKIKQEGKEKEFKSTGKSSSIKIGASPPSCLQGVCKFINDEEIEVHIVTDRPWRTSCISSVHLFPS